MRKHADKEIIDIKMIFHSIELIEKASPYLQTEMNVHQFIDKLVAGLEWYKREGAEFSGLSALHETYQQAA